MVLMLSIDSYLSKVVKEFHLLFGAIGREAGQLQDAIQLGCVVVRVEDKEGSLDEWVAVLCGKVMGRHLTIVLPTSKTTHIVNYVHLIAVYTTTGDLTGAK